MTGVEALEISSDNFHSYGQFAQMMDYLTPTLW